MDYSTLIAADGTNKAHLFDSTGEAYNACQCNSEIKTGDTLVIESEGVVGLADTWPFAITDESGDLHSVNRETATPSSHAYSCGITAEQVAHAYYIKSVVEQYHKENQ
tara:strand:- start:398 stop:721 length:324 start_codon:yes stop_codon:yes gene_type:complete